MIPFVDDMSSPVTMTIDRLSRLSFSLSFSVSLTFKYHDFRSSRDAHVQNRKPIYDKAESGIINPVLPPPPASKKPVYSGTGVVDYLSGDTYKTEGSQNSEPASLAAPAHSSPNPTSSVSSSRPHTVSTSSPIFSSQPVYDEQPSSVDKSSERLPPAHWDTQSTGIIPPPPSKYNQRQQFFEQQGASHSSSGSSSSYDSLVGQTQNLSLNSSTPTKEQKPEDALFKDLVDFAKSKTSSSSKPNRSYWYIVFALLMLV